MTYTERGCNTPKVCQRNLFNQQRPNYLVDTGHGLLRYWGILWTSNSLAWDLTCISWLVMKAVVGSGILETCHRVFISSKVSMNAPWALLAATQGRIKRQIMPWPKTFAARSRFLICPMQSCRTRNGNVFPWQWKPMRLTQHPAMLARVQSWLKTKIQDSYTSLMTP